MTRATNISSSWKSFKTRSPKSRCSTSMHSTSKLKLPNQPMILNQVISSVIGSLVTAKTQIEIESQNKRHRLKKVQRGKAATMCRMWVCTSSRSCKSKVPQSRLSCKSNRLTLSQTLAKIMYLCTILEFLAQRRFPRNKLSRSITSLLVLQQTIILQQRLHQLVL